MLVSISRALEERDGQLGHGARVSALAEPVALRLGWDRERVRTLRTSAPLHDIGKVKVRPQVLSKPGPLTPEERAEVEAHPTAGAQLVLPLRRYHDTLPYVLFHHERWDGGGYPAGLSGRGIPAEARVLAVADSFDAMISERTYRPPLSHKEALAEVERGAGTQFDPVVAEFFVEIWVEGWDTWLAQAS
jgi:HD-GYP domain-containing protein (c-di-GMP phosphodiesterase class II)